jgi:hypothetical protein
MSSGDGVRSWTAIIAGLATEYPPTDKDRSRLMTRDYFSGLSVYPPQSR